MGKRKRPAEVETVQYEAPAGNKRIVQTVQEKSGILYIQNDSASAHSQHHHQQQQQTGHQQQQPTTTTTYYQIQTKQEPGVIQEHRTVTTHQVQAQSQPPQYGNPSTEDNNSMDLVTYKCIKCQQIFESKSSFLEHCNQFHYFACDLCANCLFDDLVQLNVHMIKHINKFDMCEKCNLLCNSSDELKAHLGNHITTYNRSDVILTNANDQTTAVLATSEAANGTVALSNALNDDSLIEHLASELDQSIGNTVKIKPQKYRCGVCKQDFSDPRILFKHMNQMHINLPLLNSGGQIVHQHHTTQQQVIAQQPSPPPAAPVVQQPPPLVPTQTVQTQQAAQENIVYANIDSNSIYYDERTGQYYTIALMDHSPPLSETAGSTQSVIEYVQEDGTLQPGQHIQYIQEHPQETIIIEDESEHASKLASATHIQHTIVQQAQPQVTTALIHKTNASHHQQTSTNNNISMQGTTITQTKVTTHAPTLNNNTTSSLNTSHTITQTTTHPPHTTTTTTIEQPPPLVQITRDTDLEELIPTTTLVADTPVAAPASGGNVKHSIKQDHANIKHVPPTKCEHCHATFIKKFPKQMYCHNCVTRNAAASAKH